MPRPPQLPILPYAELFAKGATYEAWLAGAESRDNAEKMEKRRRELQLEPAQRSYLSALARPIHVLVIAEDWCGDVQRHVPVLQALADAAPLLRVRYLHRHQAPELFVRFLSFGGEAIPKFIFLSDRWVECGDWGALPDDCRKLIARGKALGDVGAARKRISALYEADPNCAIVVRELLERIETASATSI